MSMVASDLSLGRDFRVGNALNRAVQLFFSAHFPKFCAISAIAFAPLLITSIASGLPPNAADAADLERLEIFQAQLVHYGIWQGVGGLLLVLLSPIATAMSLYGAYQAMRGQPFTIGESFRAGWARFGSVLGATFMAGIITLFFLLLLFVPGIMAVCAMYVALPACVVERLGPIKCLRRSRELTKGVRWRIFGLILVVTLVGGTMGGMAGGAVAASKSQVAAGIVSFIANVISNAFAAVLSAVAYRDLRVAKEGIDIESLAKVFD